MYPTDLDGTGICPLRATILEECLPTRSSTCGRRFSAASGRRTVSFALRAMGLDQEKRFHRYHRVLREALAARVWRLVASCWACSQRHSCAKESLWSWASTRRWSDARARRSQPGASTVIRCALPTSISSRAAYSKLVSLLKYASVLTTEGHCPRT